MSAGANYANFEAAEKLQRAVQAHLAGDRQAAGWLFAEANDPRVWHWTDKAWGKLDPVIHSFAPLPSSPPHLRKDQCPAPRMPDASICGAVIARDGYFCRFCGIPVIEKRLRVLISNAYPFAVPWGRRNHEQHAAFQCMWLQFDHVLPNARGGESTLDNIVITCAACNFGRMNWTVDEAGLENPLARAPEPHPQSPSGWNGLCSFTMLRT